MAVEWQVLLPRDIDPDGPARIRDFAVCTGMDEYASMNAALDNIGRYDAVIVRVADLDRDVLTRADRLKVIAKHGAGLDNVDVEAATDNGIIVCNTPRANARSVAEHAILLLLTVRRNLIAADRHVRNGGWDRAAFAGHEIAGDTLGILGFGAIGRETATIAQGMGFSVISYDPYIETVPNDIDRVDDMQALFEAADAVSVHTPLIDETHHAVSTHELEALGPEGVLVNTSRGPVVDEAALLEALETGTIAGAGLDVFETEPPSADSSLFDRKDVVTTPHIGGVTDAALRRMSEGAAANVRAVYEGQIPDSTVNPEVVE